MVPFFVWVRLVRASRSLRVVVFENVPEFPLALLDLCLGDMFWLFPLQASPQDLGFNLVRRDRLYVILVHKHRAVLTNCPHHLWRCIVCRLSGVRTRPAHALVASAAEVRCETLDAARRRGLLSFGGLGGLGEPRPVDVLNDRERSALEVYRAQYRQRCAGLPEHNPDLFVFLGDNPWARLTWSLSGALPTLRTNAGFLWSPYAGRWLTCKERLAVMGYPVYEDLAATLGVPLWRPPDGIPLRKLAGNAMHVSCISVVLLVALGCTRASDL